MVGMKFEYNGDMSELNGIWEIVEECQLYANAWWCRKEYSRKRLIWMESLIKAYMKTPRNEIIDSY